MTVEALLGRMLGSHVACACRAPGAVPLSTLHPREAEPVTRAVRARRLEVAAGRSAARAALARLGITGAVIPRAPSGAPAWPEGIVGSITHTRRLSAAVVARATSLASVGVDAEPDEPLEEELWPAIATAGELASLRALSPANASERARSLFCAKESAYKCQYPMTGLMLDFVDLEIQLIEGGETVNFDAIFQRDAPPFRRGDRVPGRLGKAEGHVLATTALQPARRERSRSAP